MNGTVALSSRSAMAAATCGTRTLSSAAMRWGIDVMESTAIVPTVSQRSTASRCPAGRPSEDLRDAAGPYDAVPDTAEEAKHAARCARRCWRRLLPFRLMCGGIQPGPFASAVAAFRRPDVELMHEVGAPGAGQTPSHRDKHRIHARR